MPVTLPVNITRDDGTTMTVPIAQPRLVGWCTANRLDPDRVILDVDLHDDGDVTVRLVTHDDDGLPMTNGDELVLDVARVAPAEPFPT